MEKILSPSKKVVQFASYFSPKNVADLELELKHADDLVERPFPWRSVLLGTFIGSILAAQNVYFGLRNGLSFGDGMVSAIIGYGMVRLLMKFTNWEGFDIHEHVLLQTAAAANISIIFSGGFSQYILAMSPSIQEVNALGRPEDTWTPTYLLSVAWLILAAYLGFFVSQPFRTKLIIEQDLPWPGPTATATVLKALHSKDGEGGVVTNYVLGSSSFAIVWQFFIWFFNGAGQMTKWPIFGNWAAQYTIYADWSPAFIAMGMLTTKNAVYSMVMGGIFGFVFIYPIAESKRGDWFKEDDHGIEGPKAYWFLSCLAMMVVDSVYQSFKITWNSYSSWNDPTGKDVEKEPLHRLVPTELWSWGLLINMIVLTVVLPFLFPVDWYLIIVAVIVAIPMGYGVCLGGAITGTFLISAVGKLLLVILGPLCSSVMGALWISGVGMVTVGSTEQLLVDYYVGHVVGTSPRHMFIAQIFGASVGFFATPLSYQLFIDAFPITATGQFTAPGAVALRACAVLFVDGFDLLPLNVVYFVVPSALLALLFSVLNDLLPENQRQWVPNTMAFAIGFFVNGAYPINILIGGIIQAVWRKVNVKHNERFGAVVAGGLIAGEGLAAILQACLAMASIEAPSVLAVTFSVYNKT